jgi:7-cyano-7-deazaguanine synthase in queuosine biosynthesis
MSVTAYKMAIPAKAIDVVEPGRRPRRGRTAFDLGRDLKFATDGLQSYAFARWEPVIHDAMVVAAAIEYADRTVKRPSRGWARRLTLQIPVHEPARWHAPAVMNALLDAAGFLTGDFWSVTFTDRKTAALSPPQGYLHLAPDTGAVMAYSDGMDSRAVAGLMAQERNTRLVRVRVGNKAGGRPGKGQPEAFAAVPYAVAATGETSARSRGFKFALISGIAAYLAGADEIIIPESGQGAFGPALVTVAHAYADYRNHPLFTARMAKFLNALLGTSLRFSFPRLWQTKGETLRAFAALQGGDAWRGTKSCWRNSRWSALNGKLKQCGVCAACMLRRMSVHAAGLAEDAGTYVCEDLAAPALADAIDPAFKRRSAAFDQYAIAGTLHLDHLADMALPEARPAVRRHAGLTAAALGLSADEAALNLAGMLERHAAEWHGFAEALGAHSFIRQWTREQA